jgi:hypothetical protein
MMNLKLNVPGSPESKGKEAGQLFTCITNTISKKRTHSGQAVINFAPDTMNILDYSGS